MQRKWLALWIVLATAFAVGCGARDGHPSGPSQAKPAQTNEPAEADDRAQGVPSEAQPADDDLTPPAKHGLVRGLEKLQQTIPVEKARPSQKTVDLRQADELLSSAKSQNMAAIREANRQVRLSGRGTHIVLVAVAGLRCEDLACYGKTTTQTPRIDKLAAEGVRFTNFQPEGPESDVILWSLMTGLHANPPAAGQPHVLRPTDLTLPKMLWNAGYATELLGDCSLGGAIAPGDAAELGFDAWSGYRDSAAGYSPWPEQFWYQGNAARVLENADGKHGRHAGELLGQEIARCLQLHRQGRPFFLCLAWPRFSASASTTDAGWDTESLARLDLAVGAIVDQLKPLGIERRTALFLLGAGDSRLASAKRREAPTTQRRPLPLIVWAPPRFAAGVRDQRCEPCDILPTLADLAGAQRRPKVQAGTSLVSLLRRDRPAKN